MEYVEGETLAQLLAAMTGAGPEADTPFGKKDTVVYFGKLAEAFADVSDGLQHAHAKGIIHRDIKPSNLILDRQGRVRILDFGLSRLEGQESLTATGDLLGTPLYMSPEQARRKKIPIDHRTDVYSLGATMYEVLAGRPPFQGKDQGDTLSRIIEQEPIEPRKLNPRVTRDLETIVLKCLRKEAADRYGTAEALGQDLRRFVRGDPIEARPQGKWEMLRRRLARNHRLIAIRVLAVSLILFCGALLYELYLAKREQGHFEDVAAVKEVNSPFGESHPTPSADGRELYFGSLRPGGKGDWDIWMVSRPDPTGPWCNLRNVEELNSPSEEEPAGLSPDGLRLYYRIAGGGKWTICYATRKDKFPSARWEQCPLDELMSINSGHDEGLPTLTSDEREIFFHSDRPGGSGKTDIWVAERPNRSSAWGEPHNVEEINSPANEMRPCISSDGLTLFWHLHDVGEIWFATRASRTSRFGPARLVDPPVNSQAWDGQFSVSQEWPASGAKAYFIRGYHGKGGDFDIYQVTCHAAPGGKIFDR